MSGHTKGPWGSAVNLNTGAFRIVCGDGIIIAERSGWPTNEAQSAANARLIAAAPDLLEALKALLSYDEQDAGCIPTDAHLDAQNAARAAITRADGVGK